MGADLLVQILQLYGFPAAMCFWFMWRLEKRLDAIQATNHRQAVIMAVLVRTLAERKSLGAIPEDEYVDAISGVTEIPLPEETSKAIERKQS